MAIFNWEKYLNVAEHLCNDCSGEEFVRSSISRAYYSVFGKVKVYCVDHKIIARNTDPGRVHAAVINSLKAHEIKKLRILGKRLEALRERRNDADYDAFKIQTGWFAKDSIDKAKVILNSLADISEDRLL